MADASANPRGIAVGFGRDFERDHVSDLFAPPANELRAQRPPLILGGTIRGFQLDGGVRVGVDGSSVKGASYSPGVAHV
jgi:hypothetical protein